MANTIQIRRSNITGRVPGVSPAAAIGYGELAINVYDKKMYYGNAAGATTDITEVITKATTSVPGKASFASADFAVSGAAAVTISSVSNTQLAGSIADSKLLEITTADKVALTALNINGATDIGAALVSGDLIAVDDGANGTNRKSTIDRVATLFAGNGLAVSGATLAVGVDGATIEINSDALRVKAGGILNAHIGNDQVNSEHYAAGSIDTEHIDDLQVTTGKIALQAITAGQLENTTSGSTGAVTSSKFRPGAVNTAALGDDQVTNAKIGASAVGTTEIADNAVTADKILDNIILPGNCQSSGSFTVGGNLVVTGSTTTVNSTTVTIDDIVLTLGGDTAPTSDDGFDKGIEFRYFGATDAEPGGEALLGFMGWDDSTERFSFLTEASVSSGDYSGDRADIDTAKIYGERLDLAYGSGGNGTIHNVTIDCGTF